MTFENFASLGLGFIIINVKTPLDSLQSSTPIQSLVTPQDVHEIIISLVKIVLVCVVPYLFNKIFTGKKKDNNSKNQPNVD